MISVIITTYKRSPEMVSKAVLSVLKQTYTDFELIIVDDSPSDFIERSNVKHFIDNIKDDRINYIQHNKNMGACAARNTGISYSIGEYLAFLDDDDEWLPNKLEMQINKFDNQSVGLVYCDNYIVNTKKNEIMTIKHQSPNEEIISQLLTNNFIGSTSFPLIRKECFEECGMFNASMPASQDLDMWLRIGSKYKVAHVKVPLVKYYIHDEERITTNLNLKIQASKIINKQYEEFLIQNPKLHNFRLLTLSTLYSMVNDHKLSFVTWSKAIKCCPFSFYNNIFYSMKIIKINMQRVRHRIL